MEAKVGGGDVPSFIGKDERSKAQWKSVALFYENRDFRPVWIANGARQRRVDQLVSTLERASDHGLNPNDYNVDPLPNPIDDEVRLTTVLVKFVSDLGGTRAAQKPIEDVIGGAINRDSLPSLVDEIEPKHAEYRDLKDALSRYRAVLGDESLDRIKTNMERLRWMPSDFGERYIRVNIPEYSLSVIENDHPALTMRVVVGKEETPTPIFSAEMTNIVFSPYWNIPDSILTNETLPKVFEDPGYISRQNLEVIRVSGKRAMVVDPSRIDWSDMSAASGYRFRQRPGARNSLGLVKFMLPNRYDVYLHDTPADSLFDRARRDFSHGCVRLEKPSELAEYLLRDQPEWTPERIESAMHSGAESSVNLRKPIPVHIMYLTATVGKDGSINFWKDIYGHDERL